MLDKRRPEQVARPETSPASAAVTSAPPYQAVRTAEILGRGTAIGEGMSIIGDIYTEEDLSIDGHVQGKLEIKNSRLTIGPKGRAESNVSAREVVILGSLQGDVEASNKITIRKQGSLVGNIKTSGIVIDDDAYFKGSIDIVRNAPEPAKG